ncbi:ABC transporter ATP-binding protein [Nitratireductor aquimarinus]|uniref:ABC transporter ATP-binding protein n=1 Tax=Alphaproteobacteria TaxID=28211 RepID=UPI0019D3FE02|nr:MULTISPECIES: ABC transporter ATP-binding protein [Alphaproteobacteria]MBY6022921.1 ABC transporter ATP-binding protein [Nitratireductor sp. DP7N14-4]MBN7758128.1 ABC transporter ATP-binding protein [Nitratireductor aquimarinus]MBN7760400.1 ABC transporter ATP-binding protein [Nitratireductor aquibiodomus]MBN7776283.1 ABC transporter ATP-binding protein [Nitratireductor pacificus]MBN7779150.1 ABC transporter ATP-binding protein [Nitratireductor pacificus]
MTETLLSVRDLKVSYQVGKGSIDAVDGASFDVPRGSIVGLVGESGCGKTTVARALTRVIADNASITGGQILFDGQDIAALPEREMNALRWRDIAFIPQSAMNSLDPVYTVEYQLNEVLRRRGGLGRRQARARCEELFEMVGIEAGRLGDYPHQFSGGMRQRVAIALALALNPKLVIADEPVTALDVIVQRQILDQLRELQSMLGISVILVTHDISVVAYVCDRTVVMYAGRIAEAGPMDAVLMEPSHPYTMGLRNAFPDLKGAASGVLTPIEGAPPNLAFPPPGCRFAPRCPFAVETCTTQQPALGMVAPDHRVSCHRADEAAKLRQEAARTETWLADA